jgi:S-DNA-T family DNA segregation ATPase FtsK/SpoIIIE
LNILQEFMLLIRDEEMPVQVSEVITALWEKDKRPQIHKWKKIDNGYTFTIALPPSISFKDFYSKLDYFKDHAGGNKVNVSISQSGKMAIMQISNNTLKDYYDYQFVEANNMILPVPIGYSKDGLQIIDIAKHEHVLIGGETGSGKTTCLNVIIVSLLSLPEPPILIIVDLKKSGDYSYLDDRVMLITDRAEALQALTRLMQETKKRQELLYNSRCKDIHKYNKVGGKMPWIVLIIDELAQLKNEDAQETLEDLLALSRSSGVRIICATQRPSSKIFKAKSFGDAKANFTITICYRTRSAIDSSVIIGIGDAAKLKKVPGRGLLQIGCDLIEIQTPYIDIDEVMQVEQLSPRVLSKELQSCRDTFRMGGARCSTNADAFISVFKSSTKEIKGIGRGRKD